MGQFCCPAVGRQARMQAVPGVDAGQGHTIHLTWFVPHLQPSPAKPGGSARLTGHQEMLSPGHSISFLSADAGKRRTSGETDLGAAPGTSLSPNLGEGSREGPAQACAVLPAPTAPSPGVGGTCHRPTAFVWGEVCRELHRPLGPEEPQLEVRDLPTPLPCPGIGWVRTNEWTRRDTQGRV